MILVVLYEKFIVICTMAHEGSLVLHKKPSSEATHYSRLNKQLEVESLRTHPLPCFQITSTLSG